MIIALTGKLGSGKTTAASYLMSKAKDSKLIKFAQPLYDIQEFIYARIHRDQPATKDRKLLQFLGGDWGRSLDTDLWSDLWELEYRHHRFWSSRNGLVVVDDLRYDNEAAMLSKYKAKIIRIGISPEVRSSRVDTTGANHSGEAGIDSRFVTYSISNDGSQEELYRKLDGIYEELNG